MRLDSRSGLIVRNTPSYSPEFNGMAEAFLEAWGLAGDEPFHSRLEEYDGRGQLHCELHPDLGP